MGLNLDPEVLKAYGYTKENIKIIQIGSGLINRTYLLSSIADNKEFILQNINTGVFKNPQAIADNLQAVSALFGKYLSRLSFHKTSSYCKWKANG